MTRTVSIISALSKSTLPFIDDARKSVSALIVPPDVDVHWYIQHDGDSAPITREWFSEDKVHYEHNGRHLGAAGTRNQALLRTRGDFILSLDSDDVLIETALVDLLSGFEVSDDMMWSAGCWHELYPDGSTKPWRSPLFEGPREVGWISEEILRLGTTPFSMNPILYRRDAVVQAGGWPGFAEWEDTILLVVISGRHPGWATDKQVGLYRRHEASYSKSEAFQRTKPKMYAYIQSVGRAQSL